MSENDQTGFQARDIAVALALLTRLPLRLPDRAYARRAAACWAYPLVGLVVGGLSGLVAATLVGIGPGLAAIAAIGVTVILTGAMHEDGLADVADGFWGGWDRARRLEIMKDSQIGTYGVMALLLGFGLRWWALTQLFAADHILSVTLGIAVLSRGGIPLLMRWLPPARSDGLSRWVGRPGLLAIILGAILTLALGLACLGAAAALIVALQLLCLGGLGLLARRKIGGQTGDVLGAAQQISEIAALILLAALVLA